MGTRSERKTRFLLDHPVCCYCGGSEPATEEDHNPPRALFPRGGVPVGFRFPACADCNRSKKDAESRAALVANAFSRMEPHNDDELQRSIKRGLTFASRDPEFLQAIVEHPTHTWDFARGSEPGTTFDPLSFVDVPHVLRGAFGPDLLELGRYFGQALYYRSTGRILTTKDRIGVALFSNCVAEEAKFAINAIDVLLEWDVPSPADRNLEPLFAVGVRFFKDTGTLYFAGGRRGSFMWIGLAGGRNDRLQRIPDSHWWRGDGKSLPCADRSTV